MELWREGMNRSEVLGWSVPASPPPLIIEVVLRSFCFGGDNVKLGIVNVDFDLIVGRGGFNKTGLANLDCLGLVTSNPKSSLELEGMNWSTELPAEFFLGCA